MSRITASKIKVKKVLSNEMFLNKWVKYFTFRRNVLVCLLSLVKYKVFLLIKYQVTKNFHADYQF